MARRYGKKDTFNQENEFRVEEERTRKSSFASTSRLLQDEGQEDKLRAQNYEEKLNQEYARQ